MTMLMLLALLGQASSVMTGFLSIVQVGESLMVRENDWSVDIK
jgi:hypothetical protein